MGRGKDEQRPSNMRLGVVALATELGRYRALTPDESRLLERAIERQPASTRRWTFADDAKLQRLRRTRLRVPEIAAQLGRTPWAVYRRISDLKAGGRVK